MRFLIVTFIAIACSFVQIVKPSYAVDIIDSYRFESMSLKDGLLSIEVTTTFQQSNGYLWFGTSAGVSRFDGHSFKNFTYGIGKPNALSNNFINGIAEDDQENIWLATDNGLNRIDLDGNVYVYFADKKNGLESNWISGIHFGYNNSLYVVTVNGVYVFVAETETFQKLDEHVENETGYSYIAQAQEQLFFSDGYSLFVLDENNKIATFSVENELFDETLLGNISSFGQLSDGRISIGVANSSLIILDTKTFEFEYFPQLFTSGTASIASVLLTSNNMLWVGDAYNGIKIVDLSTKNITSIKEQNFDRFSLISNYIRQIFEDQSGLIWISTGDGISKYNPKQKAVKLIRPKATGEGLSAETVYSVLSIDDKHILVTIENDIDIINIQTQKISQQLLKKSHSISEDKLDIWSTSKQGDIIWMAASQGIVRYNMRENSFELFKPTPNTSYNLPEGEYYTILSDGENGAWITGIHNLGLFHFDPEVGVNSQILNQYVSKYSSESNFTVDMLMSEQGDIWLATTDGVIQVAKNMQDYHHYSLNDLEKNSTRATSIKTDTFGNIWVTTEGAGLVQFYPSDIDGQYLKKSYTTDDGLPSNTLTNVIQYGDELWITTNKELVSFNVNTEQFNTYPSLVDTANLYFFPTTAEIMNGYLFIGTNVGLAQINLNLVTRNHYKPNILISTVLAEEGNLSLNQPFSSQPISGNYVEFQFTSLDFTSPKLNKYQYRLSGIDETWRPITHDNKTVYTNLPPGQFTFEVRGTNSDGLWSNKIATYQFNVARPLWHILLAVLILLFSLLVVLHFYSRKKQMNLLARQAYTDALTGLPNRLEFNRSFKSLLDVNHHSFALVVVDLDYFKEVNDLYGHKIGDIFIKKAAKRMANCVRGRDFVARLGGDEFVILVNRFKLESNLFTMTERLGTSLAAPYIINGQSIKGSASIGVAVYPKDGNSHEELFTHADSAMYVAKQAGRNQVHFFNDSLREKLKKSVKIKTLLKSALSNNEFQMYYQPQLSLQTGELCGFESLLRWIHPKEGLIPPDAFIPEAEQSGAIVEIGLWVLNQCCRQAAKWHDAGIFNGIVAVNFSSIQVQPNLVEEIKRALALSGLPAHKLAIEITESTLMENTDKSIEILSNIKQLGVSIALDDFGTGYSSLSYLTKFPIDTIKIDKSFIYSSIDSELNRKLLSHIYSLARSLGMTVVTEGIEIQAHEQLLECFDEHIVQGYLYSRPLPVEQADEFIKRKRDVE